MENFGQLRPRRRPMLSPLARIQAICFAIMLGVFLPSAVGQSGDQVAWHTGKAIRRFNLLPISVSWHQAPLRDRVIAYWHQENFATMLDRRVDPSLPVDVRATNATFEQLAWSVAERLDLGVCRLDDFYYVGSKQQTATIPLAWQQLKKETSKRRRQFKVNWSEKKPLGSLQAFNPKHLLQKLATENQFQIENLDVLPHDIWAPLGLPPTSLDGRIAILLVGFDKWFERSADGTSIKIVDFPAIDKGRFTFRKLDNAGQIRDQLRLKFRTMNFKTSGKTITTNGPPHLLAQVRHFIVMQQESSALDKSFARFTLNQRAPRKLLLSGIAKKTGRQIAFDATNDPSFDEQLADIVVINVNTVTFSELVAEILKDTSLQYELTETTLRIYP